MFIIQELKKCFESQDVQLLQDTIKKMNQEDAAHYMKECIDSGLWVPGPKDNNMHDEEFYAEINNP